MANLGEVGNTEASEQFVGTVEPRNLGIDVLEPSNGVGYTESAYTNVELVRDFDNLTVNIIADTSPTVIQEASYITDIVKVDSPITDILKVSSEIQDS